MNGPPKTLIPEMFLELPDAITKWVDLRYEGVFIFCKKCGMIGHKTDYCKTPMEKARKRIWETLANICIPGEEHLLSAPAGIPLYSNKIKGLKGITQNKTTKLDLRCSVQNFSQNKFEGYSDSDTSSSSSSLEEENDDDAMEEDDENKPSENDEDDPDEEEASNHDNSGNADGDTRNKKCQDRDDASQKESHSLNSSDQRDMPSKR
ncbi:Halomucin [Bienertia sinuspersici]